MKLHAEGSLVREYARIWKQAVRPVGKEEQAEEGAALFRGLEIQARIELANATICGIRANSMSSEF